MTPAKRAKYLALIAQTTPEELPAYLLSLPPQRRTAEEAGMVATMPPADSAAYLAQLPAQQRRATEERMHQDRTLNKHNQVAKEEALLARMGAAGMHLPSARSPSHHSLPLSRSPNHSCRPLSPGPNTGARAGPDPLSPFWSQML
jgi:hypothetical protein